LVQKVRAEPHCEFTAFIGYSRGAVASFAAANELYDGGVGVEFIGSIDPVDIYVPSIGRPDVTTDHYWIPPTLGAQNHRQATTGEAVHGGYVLGASNYDYSNQIYSLGRGGIEGNPVLIETYVSHHNIDSYPPIHSSILRGMKEAYSTHQLVRKFGGH
jgi:hypothetical protein